MTDEKEKKKRVVSEKSLANLRPVHWKPGQSGNPVGRPKIPQELKDCTTLEIRKIIWDIWKRPQSDIDVLLENPATPVGVAFIAKVFARGIDHGDHLRLDMLLSRLVGKVKEVVELHQAENLPTLEEARQIIEADFARADTPPVVVIESLDPDFD